MARHQLFNNQTNENAPQTESDWHINNASASEVAERFVDPSAFVFKGYCTGILMVDLPIFKTMKHLSHCLYSYAFSIVVEKSVNFLTRPGQSTTLSTAEAAETMSQRAGFLERKASDLGACGLSSGTEAALASNLNFAKDYTTSLLGVKAHGCGVVHPQPTRGECSDSQPPILGVSTPRSEEAVGRTKASEVPSEHVPAIASVPPAEVREVRNGEHAKFLETLLHAKSSARRIPADTVFNSELEVTPQTASSTSSRATSPAGCAPHHGLPAPSIVHHAPNPLDGPRLRSHLGLQNDDAFEELCLRSAKIPNKHADPCTAIQIGHSTTEIFQPHQYFDIAGLGFGGIKAVNLMHPLCAEEIKGLSLDVLKYIDFVLREADVARSLTWQRTNSKRAILARNAEKKSMRIVERELKSRNWELQHKREGKQTHVTVSSAHLESTDDAEAV
ncbi:hypothetical protein BST61_g6212 [Cercospora zeina]